MTYLSATIQEQIKAIPDDTSFGYGQLTIPARQYQSAAKVLERLQKKGLIRKLSKGIFYKPKKTIFGEKKPGEEQILKPYLYRDSQRIAYITGTYLYNQMGLTTQVPAIIQIASRDRRIFINRGTIQATAVKSYVDVSEDNYRLLGLLDALKDMKDIADLDLQAAIEIVTNQIRQLTKGELTEIVGYALKYPPRVRALLGAILSVMGKAAIAKILKESLNPLTVFKLGINDRLLPSAPEWNIQ
ncbi:DUF6088 family protein [Dyadobacter chenwenxiniae]|uniref:DUF6088 family protein n=1 Tax=Dyadobacter chenwenxiniae TaxID=2906456 RepID=A0A9X1TEC1_9BACT|nr:DUF6088 family protein [Dyadobacter chenwenxiniae]MCF0061330.1 DUF6088 family protein [Dyadobacter chenwenxiniae]UON81152.1 DUF6088 family protein [Dyadobacter chenwenxiniae]